MRVVVREACQASCVKALYFLRGLFVGRVVKDCVAASERLEKEKEMQCCQQVGSC